MPDVCTLRAARGQYPVQPGDQRRGVSLMRAMLHRLSVFGLVAGPFVWPGPPPPGPQPATAPGENLVEKLSGADAPADIDPSAIRAQVPERLKSKAEMQRLRRPP